MSGDFLFCLKVLERNSVSDKKMPRMSRTFHRTEYDVQGSQGFENNEF